MNFIIFDTETAIQLQEQRVKGHALAPIQCTSGFFLPARVFNDPVHHWAVDLVKSCYQTNHRPTIVSEE
jgi:hypothetical protein